MRRVQTLLLVLLTVFAFVPVAAVDAQSGDICFPNIPNIEPCIPHLFASYWQQNGGLPVFGYPITPAQQRPTDSGRPTQTQFFERNSLEINVDQAAPPFHILLGRLGDKLLQRAGRNWRNEGGTPNPWPGTACKAFTIEGQQRSVCGPFLEYWQRYGLELGDRGVTERESMMLFGLPLTAPKTETNPNGDTVMTQWFERARFEYHPNNPPASRVLLGLLGREHEKPAPGPTPSPSPSPSPPVANDPCAGIAPARFAIIKPNCIKYGQEFEVLFYGFEPNEAIGVWITHAESGETVGTTRTLNVDAEGELYFVFPTRDILPPGNYVFVAQESAQTYEPSVAPFRVIP